MCWTHSSEGDEGVLDKYVYKSISFNPCMCGTDSKHRGHLFNSLTIQIGKENHDEFC